MSAMQKRPTGVAWRKRAKATLIAQSGARCAHCGKAEGFSWKTRGWGGNLRAGLYTLITWASDLAVDHKVALADGGTNDIANLQLLCDACHLAKTVAEKRARRDGL